MVQGLFYRNNESAPFKIQFEYIFFSNIGISNPPKCQHF